MIASAVSFVVSGCSAMLLASSKVESVHGRAYGSAAGDGAGPASRVPRWKLDCRVKVGSTDGDGAVVATPSIFFFFISDDFLLFLIPARKRKKITR